jgi:hypothetical protein
MELSFGGIRAKQEYIYFTFIYSVFINRDYKPWQGVNRRRYEAAFLPSHKC